MTQISQALVSHIGDDKFRIDLPPKTRAMEAFLKTGTNRLSIVLDKPKKYALAVEGTREDLLSWLKSMEISEEALTSFEEAMQE